MGLRDISDDISNLLGNTGAYTTIANYNDGYFNTAQSNGGQAPLDPTYGFIANVAGVDLMVAEQAALQTLGKVAAEASYYVKAFKFGGAAANLVGTAISYINYKRTGQITASDVLGGIATTAAIGGIVFSAPAIGAFGLGVGLFQMFSGTGGYLDLDNTIMYDNKNGGLQYTPTK